MAVISELIRKEGKDSISFGNYLLDTKSKLDGFDFNGDLYKIKTFKEITKLEKNGTFVYESVPGTVVHEFKASDKEVSFKVEAANDAQITLELENDKEYEIIIDGNNAGKMKTNLGGKLNLSVELNKDEVSTIEIKKL